MCVLASMMLDPDMCDELLGVVESEWFYLADHVAIFDAIANLRKQAKPVDGVIVKDALKRSGQLEGVGGVSYLGDVFNKVPSAAHGREYAERVREHFLARRAIEIATRAIADAYEGRRPSGEILAGMSDAAATSVSGSRGTGVLTLDEVMGEAVASIRDPNAAGQLFSFGFPSLDASMSGIGPGEICLVCARPSMGKSTLMRQVALLAAMRGEPMLYVSLEESPRKVGRNFIANLCKISNKRLRVGLQGGIMGKFGVTNGEMARVDETAATLKGLPFYFVWNVRRAEKLRAIAASYKARFGIRGIFIDYLQLVDGGGKSAYERATASSLAVTDLARSLGVAVICASQLNRANTNREDKRPDMSDIRDSGQIEQDADMILGVHREDYYHLGEPGYQPTHEAEILQIKVRDGERGPRVVLKSNMQFQMFEDPQAGQQQTIEASLEL